jgi:hypothetical protein
MLEKSGASFSISSKSSKELYKLPADPITLVPANALQSQDSHRHGEGTRGKVGRTYMAAVSLLLVIFTI